MEHVVSLDVQATSTMEAMRLMATAEASCYVGPALHIKQA